MNLKMRLPTLEDWAWVTVMLVQALIGSISRNVSEVRLGFSGGRWQIIAALEVESKEDRLEFEDICEYFDLYMDGVSNRISSVADTSAAIQILIEPNGIMSEPTLNERVIFKKKRE